MRVSCACPHLCHTRCRSVSPSLRLICRREEEERQRREAEELAKLAEEERLRILEDERLRREAEARQLR